MIQMPLIHTNGTSAQTLLDDNLKAYRALCAAEDAICKGEFNARDYYPTPGAWERARNERAERLKAIREAKEYFMAISEWCSDAVCEVESRRAKNA